MTASISQAFEIIGQSVVPIKQIETIEILSSVGRVCAKDMQATLSLPRFDHSAMDGYGVRLEDGGGVVLVQESLYAGAKDIPNLKDKHAIRIMTGAPIPKGCEAIVPLEDIIYEENESIRLPQNLILGKHIRKKGEELSKGIVYLAKGEEITPYMVGMLASQGVREIEVFAKPKVAILSTGDELRPYTQKELGRYEIYDSNTPMFAARIGALGCTVEVIQCHTDDHESIKERVKKIFYDADFVLSTGGASVGDRDMTKKVFEDLGGDMVFDKIDIKPGKPTSFGFVSGVPFLMLPGNPLAAMVNFELFGVSLVQKLRGRQEFFHTYIKTHIKEKYRIKKGKNSAILGYFDGSGFEPLTNQSPNQVSSLHRANSIMLVSPQIESLEANETIKIIVLDK